MSDEVIVSSTMLAELMVSVPMFAAETTTMPSLSVVIESSAMHSKHMPCLHHQRPKVLSGISVNKSSESETNQFDIVPILLDEMDIVTDRGMEISLDGPDMVELQGNSHHFRRLIKNILDNKTATYRKQRTGTGH